MSEGADTTRLLETLRLVGRALDDGAHPWALVGEHRGKPLSETIPAWLEPYDLNSQARAPCHNLEV